MDFKPNKKLGFGLMRMPLMDPKNDADVDIEQVCKMVDIFIEKGFTYFDTAWMYNGFASESVAKKALVDRYDRDRFTLSTKLHCGFFDNEEEREKYFETQLTNTGAGYFDYYLIHGIEDAGPIAALVARRHHVPFVFEKHSDPASYKKGGLDRKSVV